MRFSSCGYAGLLAFALLVVIREGLGMENGDLVSAIQQTLHNRWKSPKLEMPLHHLPRFREPGKFVMHAAVPGQDGNEAEFDLKNSHQAKETASWMGKNVKINPEEDVKISFTFAHRKFLVPWIPVYDSKKRRSLDKLIITFDHDQHDVLEVHYERIYGKEIQRLDPNHPSLVGFEIVYQWRAADDTDFSSGIFEMFLMALIFGTAIVFLAVVYDPMQKASKPVMAKRIRRR
jgi:hypothetical protein